ncbi:MAG: hypothetical protein D6818_08260, partial [Bacteroidetes bacterium]
MNAGTWIKGLLVVSLLCNLLALAVGLWAVHRLGGWRYLLYRFQTRGVGAEYAHRKSQLDMLPADSATIVMLGNSLTRQGEWAELLQNPKVRNRGINGDHIGGVLDRLDEVVEQQPEWLFLMIGINDLLFHEPDFVIKQYEVLLQRLTEALPHTRIVVQSLLPVNNEVRPLGISNEDIRTVNAALRELAPRYGCRFLDLYPRFVDRDGR